MLNSQDGLSIIQLKNEYADYDSYRIEVSLVDISNNYYNHYSNGGIGISEGDDIWVNQLQLTRNNSNQWYRYFDVTKYGTVSYELPNGEHYKGHWFDKYNGYSDSWRNESLKMIIEVVRSTTNDDAYDVATTVYEKESGDELVSIQSVVDDEKLDFNKIYLADLMPYGAWNVSFDEFDFVATKDMRFTSLKLSHEDDDYKLSWEPVDGAEEYIVFFGDTEATVATKYGDTLDVTINELFIDDTSWYKNKYFKVVAILSDMEIGSNAVKLNGDVSMSTLQGRFDGEDYILSWNKFNSADKYQLYYGESENSVDTLLPGSENLSASTLQMRLEDMDATSDFYNKYVQLRALDGDVVYYSNVIKIEDDLRLGVEFVDDSYYLKWSTNTSFKGFYIYYGNKVSKINKYYDYVDGDTMMLEIPDNNNKSSKYFQVWGLTRNNKYTGSNYVKLAGDMTVPKLTWFINDEGVQELNWGDFSDPEKMTLYYGESIDQIDHVMSDPENLPDGTTSYTTNDTSSMNKYIQLRFVKDGIVYYSNVVRSTQFTDIIGEVNPSETAEGEKDLLVKWTNDPDAVGYEVRYRTPGNSGEGTLISGGLSAGSTEITIKDIYGDKKNYLDEEIIVISIYEGDLRTKSSPIVVKEVSFDSLKGVLNSVNLFNINWGKPYYTNASGGESFLVDHYTIRYGSNATIQRDLVENAEHMDELTFDIANVTGDVNAEGYKYYNKYFSVTATKDKVSYVSNVIKSIPQSNLSVTHVNDTYILDWESVAGATGYKVFHGDTELTIDTPYGGLLDITPTELSIPDGDDVSNDYFKVVAILDGGIEIESNSVKLLGNQNMSVLTGVNNVVDYDLSWTAFDGATSYTLKYMDTIDGVEKVMPQFVNIPNDELSKRITNIANSAYNNKYIRLIVNKGNIEFKSNLVRASQIGNISGRVKTNEDENDKKDLVVNWTDALGATSYEVRYREPGSTGEGSIIKTDIGIGVETYAIEDIYGQNRVYLGQEIFVVAKYGDDVKVISKSITAREVKFDTFKGSISKTNVFASEWKEAQVLSTTGQEELNADSYTIFYGDNKTLQNTVVDKAKEISQMNFDIEDVTNTDSSTGHKYYNKYFVVSANKDGVSYDSNVVRSLPQGELSVTHVNDTYILDWESVAGATGYKVFRGDTELTIDTPYGGLLDITPTELSIPDGDDVSNDCFKIVAILDGDIEIESNSVKLLGDQTMSLLTGRDVAENYELSWTAFTDAESYTLVYMNEIDGTENVVGVFRDMPSSELSKQIESILTSEYNNKFVRLIAKKSNIEFKSNVVRASRFADAYGHVTIDGTKRDFDFKWTEIADAIDYVVYYENSDGVELEYPEDLNANSTQITTIKDIENSDYNGMTFRVEAVFDGDVRVTSGAITHNSTVSTKLESVLNTETNDYTLSWTSTSGAEKYRIVYDDQAPILDTNATVLEWLDATKLSEVLNDVSATSPYYHKHFKVQVLKSGVIYDSNTVYSGESPVLSIDKYYGDDFKLHWPLVEKADSIIVQYAEKEDAETYSVYELPLAGSETKKGIADVLRNKKYDNKYFRIVAVFNGFEIESNTVFLTTEVESPVISGRYTAGDYNITWDLIENATSIDIMHVDRDKDNNNALKEKFVISSGNSGTDVSYIITSAEDSGYYEEYVQIRATIKDDKGNEVVVYSNEVFVEEAIIDGTNPTDGGNTVDQPSIEQGEFDGDIVKLRMGNEFEVGYKFVVNDDMYNPYFKVTLQGNEYLSYDKIIAGLYNETTGEKIPVRLVYRI